MHFSPIVIAIDESEAGRYAVQWGLRLAGRTGADVVVFRAVLDAHGAATAVAGGRTGGRCGDELDRLTEWLEPQLRAAPPDTRCTTAIVRGVPSVEIARFAQERQAGLLVLGRKPRSRTARLLLGDTAAAVARRSWSPCAFVPVGSPDIRRVLVALDGSSRGLAVHAIGVGIGEETEAELRFVTVEPDQPGEEAPGTGTPSLARTEQLGRYLMRDGLGDRLIVRRGDVPGRLLETAAATRSDTIVVGNRRGGPAGIAGAGSVARAIMQTAPGVVVTVPI